MNQALTVGASFTAPAPVTLANGEHFQVSGGQTIYLVFNGSRYGYPDLATFQLCTGNNVGVARQLSSMPSLSDGGTLPSSSSSSWLNGSAPVKTATSSTIYVVVGCVKAGIPDLATYQSIYGDQSFARVQVATDAALNALPSGPTALPSPVRAAGTLIQGSGQEVRWVTYNGGSLGVPSIPVLTSQCRSTNQIVTVSDAQFNAYVTQAVLQPGRC